jgi:hypothetical protein
MLQCEITAEGVTSQIDDLLSKQKIKLSNCLRLTKYKALINQCSNNNRKVL